MADDDTTKAVVLHNAVSFGYTGLAELPRAQAAIHQWRAHLAQGWIPTHQWLTEVLGVATKLSSLNEVLQFLCGEATASMGRASARVTDPANRRHAFIGVGWTKFGPQASLHPFVCSIGNYKGTSVQDFEGRLTPLGKRPVMLYSSSAIPRALEVKLGREIRNYLRRSAHPAPVARLLQNAVRSVANTNDLVGSGLLVTCLPRGAVEAATAGESWKIEASQPSPDAASFLYLPAGSNVSHQAWPGLVLPGGNVFIDGKSSGGGTPVVVEGGNSNG